MSEPMPYKGRSVLVTGGTGMIGRYLVDRLLSAGARVRVVSLDDPAAAHPGTEFRRADLSRFADCLAACEGVSDVFHLAGVKGSPLMTRDKPASFFVPTLSFNTNMMEAARQAGVERYLYTSTIGVYSPAEVFREEDVWKTFPSDNDRFAGWAKRMGELQAQAYAIEYGWKGVAIVRPANVYGRFDNFAADSAMVIPSLIRRAIEGEDPLTVWGDGSPIRDFIHADDAARGMMLAIAHPEKTPVNLGSGVGVSIREIVEIIVRGLERTPRVEWDASKPSGDRRRLMDMSVARDIGFEPEIPIERGILDVMRWYRSEGRHLPPRPDAFGRSGLIAP